MAISDHIQRTEKLNVRITTVDTATRRIEGVGKEANPYQIQVYDIGQSFRWPIEGEIWTIYRQNGVWFLGSRYQDNTDPDTLKIEDMNPGDMRLDASIIYDALGNRVEVGTGVPSGPAGGDLAGSYPNPTIKNSVALGGNPTTTTQSSSDNSTKVATTAFVTAAVGAIGGWPSTVTSLPGSPVDGQEISFLVDSTNGTIWRFKYRLASASASKWEFIGGGWLRVAQTSSSNQSTASTATWVQMTNIGSITIPLAGDYMWIAHGSIQQSGTTAIDARVSAYQNGTTNRGTIAWHGSGTQFNGSSPSIIQPQPATFATSDTLSLAVATNNQTVAFGNPSVWRLMIQPTRVT